MPSSDRMNWPFPTENQTPWYEAFEDLIAAQDTSSFAARDDRNLVIAGGGNLSWTVATSTFQWTADIRVLSPITGGLLTVPAGALVLDDGDAVFVNLVRAVPQSNTLFPAIGSTIPSSDTAFLLASRTGDVVYFRNGQRLDDGDVIQGLGFGTGPGTGDVVGPAGATDSAVALYDNTSGQLLKNSVVTVDPSGNIATPGTVNGRDLSTDGAKLDGIEALADVTDYANVKAAGALMADGTTALAGSMAVAALITIDGRDLSVDGAKLDLIEPLADVTDYANVKAAGALMADGTTALAGSMAVSALITIDGRDLSVDGAKLDLVEALADVTDTTNVAAAGALMRTGGNLTGNVTADGGVLVDGRDLSVDGAKLDNITFTTPKDLDAMVTAIGLNTAKVTNANHTGDASGATVLTIGANKVTLAMMAQVATATLLGRETAATGNVEALTATQARTVLNVEDGSEVNKMVGFGAFDKRNDTIGTPPTGEFDVNSATISSITSIRFTATGSADGGPSVIGGLDQLATPGFLQFQDVTDPFGAQVQFTVTNAINTAGVYADLTVVWKRTSGTNWSANNYNVVYTSLAGDNYHLRLDVGNDADGIELLERADHPNTPLASKGQVWAKNEAPNELFFTDDTGVDQNISWWMKNLASITGGFSVCNNAEQKTSPFATLISGYLSCEYNELADKFYCTYVTSGEPGACNAYDSDDGITWSSLKTVDASATYAACSQPASDGTYFGIGCDNTFYRSTNLLVTNTVSYGTFANIVKCTGLVYSTNDNLWIACGTNGTTTGYIESSPNGLTWTLRRTLTATQLPFCIDHDPVGGYYIVGCGTTTNLTYFSTNGTTWTQDVSNLPTNGLVNVWWYRKGNIFLGTDSVGNLYASRTSSGLEWFDTTLTSGYIMMADDDFCLVGNGAATSSFYGLGLTSEVLGSDAITRNHSGYMHNYMEPYQVSYGTTRGGRYKGGKGVIAWPTNATTSKLNYARYAPGNE